MKFTAEQTFTGITLEEYEQLHFSEEFQIALCNAVKLARRLDKRDDDGKHLSRIVSVGPDREIPPAAKKILKADRIEYAEHLEYDWGSYKGTWRTISSIMTDKVDAHGTFSFKAVPNGVLRSVEGEVAVKLFGIGSVVEKFVVADIQKSYQEAGEFTQKWIDENKATKAS